MTENIITELEAETERSISITIHLSTHDLECRLGIESYHDVYGERYIELLSDRLRREGYKIYTTGSADDDVTVADDEWDEHERDDVQEAIDAARDDLDRISQEVWEGSEYLEEEDDPDGRYEICYTNISTWTVPCRCYELHGPCLRSNDIDAIFRSLEQRDDGRRYGVYGEWSLPCGHSLNILEALAHCEIEGDDIWAISDAGIARCVEEYLEHLRSEGSDDAQD